VVSRGGSSFERLSTGSTLLVRTPVLSHLLIHVFVFEFLAGGLGTVWLIDSGCSRHMTRDWGWFSSLTPVVSKTESLCGSRTGDKSLPSVMSD
jgi:hypothetical protein